MNVYTEKNYGADADGNRGVSMTFVELDDTEDERNMIAEEIFEDFLQNPTGSKSVEFDCTDFDVDFSEYYPELFNLLDENYYNPDEKELLLFGVDDEDINYLETELEGVQYLRKAFDETQLKIAEGFKMDLK